MFLITVSKPDAENPIVKRAKIPKPELKTGSEDYQKNASSINLIGELHDSKVPLYCVIAQ